MVVLTKLMQHLPAGVHFLSAESQEALERARLRGAEIERRHRKPDWLAESPAAVASRIDDLLARAEKR